MGRNLCLGALLLAGISAVGPNDIRDEGVGTYTDPSVANQISNFTINRQMVSCGVGMVGASGALSGPFAMLMYAKDIQFYHADHAGKTITASGRKSTRLNSSHLVISYAVFCLKKKKKKK